MTIILKLHELGMFDFRIFLCYVGVIFLSVIGIFFEKKTHKIQKNAWNLYLNR